MVSTRNDPYAYSNTFYQGMKNIAYLSGVLRRPEKDKFYIQLNNRADLLVPVFLTKGRMIPGRFTEGLPIKAICRIRGVMDKETGERGVELHAISLMRPQLNEIPASAKWLNRVEKESIESPDYKPFDRDTKPTKEANKVQLAGIVSARYIEPPSTLDQGRRTVVILIQQKEDPAEAIPVRVTPNNPQKVKEIVSPGVPLLFEGEIRLRAVPVGEQDESGVQKVRLIPYVYGGDLPITADKQVIQVYPEWAQSLFEANKPIAPRSPAGNPKKPLAGGSAAAVDDNKVGDAAKGESIEALLDQAGV